MKWLQTGVVPAIVAVLTAAVPAAEFRGVWNHSGTGAYPGDWDRSARLLARCGFTAVLPNMLSPTAAHYPSDVLPRSGTFRRHGDQLAACCAAAKEHDLQVHVWMVCYKCLRATRDWLDQLERDERLQVDVEGEIVEWLCPSSSENVQLHVDAVGELLDRYPIDGVHLDYVRYPGRRCCYCDRCRRRFEAASPGGRVRRWPDDCCDGPRRGEYARWRRRQVTRLVGRIRATIDRRPAGQGRGGRLSAAVFGYYPDCREAFAQDWGRWVRRGWLDLVCPMNYTPRLNEFTRLTRRQTKRIGDRAAFCPGIGAAAAGMTLSADQVAAQIARTRQLASDGFVIFDLTSRTAERLLPNLQPVVQDVEQE